MLPIVAPMLDKAILLMALKRLFSEKKVVRYVAILESWALQADTKRYENAEDAYGKIIAEYGSLKNHPDMKEIICIEANDGFRSIMGSYEIMRPRNEKPKLAPFVEIAGGAQGGTFANLLSAEDGSDQNGTIH